MIVCRLIIWPVVRLRFQLRFWLFFRQRFYRLLLGPFGPGLWIFLKLLIGAGCDFWLRPRAWTF